MILLPALFFTSLWDADHTETGMNILFFAGIIFCVSGIYAVISSRKETAYQKNFRTGGIFVAVSGALLSLVIRTPMYQDLTKWTAPAVNNIAYWTIACALISLLGMSVIYVSSKAKNGTGFDAYGITFRPAVIVSSFAAALLTVVVSYAVLFLVDKLLLTDFRIWTFAFKTFDANILRAVFRYWPTFFVYYLISSAAVFVNTNTEKFAGNQGLSARDCSERRRNLPVADPSIRYSVCDGYSGSSGCFSLRHCADCHGADTVDCGLLQPGAL